MTTTLKIGAVDLSELPHRLICGTGKYASYEVMQRALEVSGCRAVTVAIRRERLIDNQGRSLLDYLDLDRYTILLTTVELRPPSGRSDDVAPPPGG